MKNLKQQFSKYDKSLEKTKPQYSALLGKTSTVVEHPTRKGFCYARMADNLNELIVVFNDKVSQVWNLPVLVSRRGNTWYVVGRDTLRYANWGSDSSFIPKHASQHEFNRDKGTGGDAVFIYPDQFVPLLCYPSGTNGSGNVIVSPYMLQRATDFAYVGNTGSPSLLPYKPMNNQGIMGLVYLDKTTGNPGLLIASGTPFAGSITGSAALTPYLPYPSSNQEPLYFVRLVSGTSSILWDNLYNARQFIGGSTSTGTSGGVTDHEALTGLLGGSANNHWHLTPSQLIIVSGTSGVNTGNQDLSYLVNATGTSYVDLTDGGYTSQHQHTGTVSSFITGSVPYAGANGQLTEDNPNFYFETLGGEKTLWVGGRRPGNYAGNPSFQGYEYMARATGTNTTVAYGGIVAGTGTSGSPSTTYNGFRSRGTFDAPLPVKAGDALLTMVGNGYDGANFIAAARQRVYANSDWITGTNQETRYEWEVTPSGTSTRRVGAILYGDSFNLTNTGTYNINGSPHTHQNLNTLIAPAVNVLTILNAAAATLALNITATKTLTLTCAGDYTLTVPGTGVALVKATALTAGYIPFGIAGNLVGEDAGLFWDNTNKRLGIGTAAPGAKLEVAGSGTGRIFLGQWTLDSSYGAIGLAGSISSTDANFYSSVTDTNLYINRPSGKDIYFREAGANQVTIKTGGNVGIGTTSPGYKLDVAAAAANGLGLQIKADGSADTVFNMLGNTSGTQQLFSIRTNGAGAVHLNTQNSARLSFGVNTGSSAGSVTEHMVINSSGNVGIGTTGPNAAAILELASTTKGFRLPNMTTTQRNAISSPPPGLMVFDTTLDFIYRVKNDGTWSVIIN